ncbi:MAG: hypothetical protein M9890_03710 [Thermomicrobiales bacterium]|nr:hypothetical protein [Thermomicrobiales bacterium]
MRSRLREQLRGIGDIERVINRVVNAQAQPREMATLGASLRRLPALAELVSSGDPPPIVQHVPLVERAADETERALADDLPAVPSRPAASSGLASAELMDCDRRWHATRTTSRRRTARARTKRELKG